MRRRTSNTYLRFISIGLILAAVLLAVFQLIRYSRMREAFPPGLLVAGVPVGGLTQQQAAERLVQAYSVPVELRYNTAIIQVRPAVVGFELDLQSMLAAADLQRVNQPFWAAFWDYLWNRSPNLSEVPLRANLSEERMRSYLTGEIAVRYDQPASAALPIPGTTNFQSGQPGSVLDIDRAVVLINDALRSPASRVINLTYSKVSPPRPSFSNLQILLKQVIDVSGFDGLTEVYVLDLQSRQEVHFAYQQGKNLPVDIAFTAASTIKIPIMVSVMRRTAEPTPKRVNDALTLMIERSENDPADALMSDVLDRNLGPLMVTTDMTALGMKNTFLAGSFYLGAPLLKRYTTPANARTDVRTAPDVYNQTTAAEMGMLLDDIYQCADTGGGSLAAVFPGEISQAECRQMVNYLILNKIPVLLTAGLPEGTQIAHKHGWITESDGLIHTLSDVGIIYTPGGNYIMTFFMHQPQQLLFDPANKLGAQLSQAVYNYFNQTR